MKRSLLTVVIAITLAAIPSRDGLAQSPAEGTSPSHGLVIDGDHFTLDGKPFKVLSGELHYARIPPEYWRARLKMARAMGLNTIATYVFWNLHEPQPGVYDFSGQNDLAAFIKAAQEEGLYVILRAGPYVCAEWELGGLPSWLLKDPASAAALRSDSPLFLEPTARWIKRLNQEVGGLQIGHGGPILITQVENEYGSFGNDHKYMADMRDIFVKAGFTASMLDTVDGPPEMPNGSLPGIFAGVNFGIGSHKNGMDTAAAFRPGQPVFVTEYWPGWFDSWGHPHQTRPTAPQLEDVDYILSHGAGINLYMFHGGTSFGFMSGADMNKGNYLPDTTSYDYGAPLDESGRPTPKYFELRKIFAKYSACGSEACLPEVPKVEPAIAIPTINLAPNFLSVLWTNVPAPIASPSPLTMEAVGQNFGYILYRTQLRAAVSGNLTLTELHDYAQIYLDGELAGTLDRRNKQSTLPITTKGAASLDILVENTARVNYSKAIRGEEKGITKAVTLDGQALSGWQIFSLPMEKLPGVDWNPLDPNSTVCHSVLPGQVIDQAVRHKEFMSGCSHSGPRFSRGTFALTATGDTFLDTSALGKGVVWINGHNLGRFWNVGPQATLYVPGPWLKQGQNEIVVFDMNPSGVSPTVSGLDHPILDAPVTDQSGNRKQE
jgi:beta-galactosidase